MLLKKIIGIVIIVSNMIGVGFLLFLIGMTLRDKFIFRKSDRDVQHALKKKIEPKIINDDIILSEDDLLKDMSLSDLENIDLDDFE